MGNSDHSDLHTVKHGHSCHLCHYQDLAGEVRKLINYFTTSHRFYMHLLIVTSCTL